MARQPHPQLKKQLVTEALLEVRFVPPSMPYGIIPGQLYEALKVSFPKAIELPAAQMPIGLGPEKFVRHRFLSEDEDRMFQVGVGVFSVNHVHYAGFEKFVNDCQAVLSAAKDVGLLNKIERLGLRYINMAELNHPWFEIITIKVDAPDTVQSEARAQEHKWFTQFTDRGILSTTIAWPIEGIGFPALVIDLDYFLAIDKPLSIDQILEWLDTAHENIYTVFESSLTPQYFSELRGK